MTPQTLADVLHPVSQDEFLTQYLHRSFLRVPGEAGKFRSLLSWRRLNALLQKLRMDPPRLHLAMDGEYLPETEFLRRSRARRGAGLARLDPVRLNRHLRRGASLVLDAVDQIVEPIGALTDNFERELHESIQVNAYATFGPSRGFGLHCDSHDVLIVQVAGRKAWSVHGPSPPSELGGRAEPPAAALWEGMLEDGDCLYLPRGWWHAVVAQSEPSLHLTFGITNRTGVHLLSWLSGRLARMDVFQEDLPRVADPATREAHLERLREALLREWTPDLMERFSRDYEARQQPCHRLSLPWSAQATPLPAGSDGDSLHVALNLTRNAELRVLAHKQQAELQDLDRCWQFPLAMEPLLRVILDGGSHTLGELGSACPGLPAAMTRTFLTLLVVEGVVSIDDPAAD